MKILIAEDDLVTRALLKRILGNMSHEVIEAGDGLAALEKIESADPDLLLTDLHMPELDGRTLVEMVRSSKAHGKMPIVCMSAVKDKAEIVELISLGIQGYILKPVSASDVQERFKQVIAQHGAWRATAAAAGRQTLLLVDPDNAFREFARGFLEPRYNVIEATSGAHALRVYKEGEAKPSVVVVAKDLPLVDEGRLVGFIRSHAESGKLPSPAFWLLSEDGAVPAELGSTFAGRIARSLDADAFTAALAQTLLRPDSAAA
jgi:two-component system, chemotaxis family, chemotaxis protein CheY